MQPEIYKDELYYRIIQLVEEKRPKTILEIGSATGLGSTAAFIEGANLLEENPQIFCMEINKDRYNELCENTKEYPFVKCYHLSSVPESMFPPPGAVEGLMARNKHLKTNQYGVDLVLSWRSGVLDEMRHHEIADIDGILKIANDNNLKKFDMVLVDGSPFTGLQETFRVSGDGLLPSDIIILDDIIDIKCWEAFCFLGEFLHYERIGYNPDLRNGYAVFENTGGNKCE